MQCPEPTCVAGCPLGVHIPEWLALTAEGNFLEAAASPFHDLAVNERGAVIVDANHMTSIPGILAGGDLVRGPTTALHAVRDARRAAIGIHGYCAGRDRRFDAAAAG